MIKRLRSITVSLLSLLLVVAQVQSLPVQALGNENSIASPETLVHVGGVKTDQRQQSFNSNWKFIYGEQSNAELNSYDDSKWSDIQLPHDYSLDLAYSKQGEAESGYKLGGIGWYRKAFTLEAASRGKRVVVEFDGVYQNSTVYINGHKLGDYPSGYVPFAYDLTDYINYDGENVLAVRANNDFPNSRWYSGSGIYRNVKLTLTDDVYVDHYGVQIVAPAAIEDLKGQVELNVKTNYTNSSDEDVVVSVIQKIAQPDGGQVLGISETPSTKIGAGESHSSNQRLDISNPELWSLDNPYLYDVITQIIVDGDIVDEVVTEYGIRSIRFDANQGFFLNGEAVKLQGVSMHSDQGSLGAAAHERAIERQVEILLDMGVNAIRVTHNPAAAHLIDVANRKGMLIIDEAFDTWVSSKNGNYNDSATWFNRVVGETEMIGADAEMTWAQHDIQQMVRSGMNAPSIISWSIGNEVMEGNSGPYGDYPQIAAQLAQWVKDVDTTRPATIGDNKLKDNWNEAKNIGQELTKLGGTVGLNYASGANFDTYHRDYPEWLMYGAETASSINSRGVYKPSNYDKHLTSYDESRVGWGHLSADSWHSIITRDFMAGEFVWTGFDYLGEPTPFNAVGPGTPHGWPAPKSSYFGIVDTAGLPKDRFYFYQSQWNDKVNTLHILPAWQEDMLQIDNSGNVRVDVYSDASTVELFHRDTNGIETSLGSKTFTKYTTEVGHTYQLYEGEGSNNQEFRNMYLTWSVPYKDGSLFARAYDVDGVEITDNEGRNKVENFGPAAGLSLDADRSEITADGKDLSYITIDVLDKDGKEVADANNLLNVSVKGEGKLVALDNGDQVDHEPYDSGKRKAFNGKLVAIVQATDTAGSIEVTVSGEGIQGKSIQLTSVDSSEVDEELHVVAYSISKNHYVKTGFQPQLQNTTKVYLSDGTQETLPIVWDSGGLDINQTGTQSLVGHVEKHDLRVLSTVTFIETVGAVLNYSMVVPTNTQNINLPSSRPIVLENGEVLDTEFPVVWSAPAEGAFDQEGTVVIHGTAMIFGEAFPLTTTVRVSDAEVTLGANVAGNYLTLDQSIPEALQSDNLLAIVDGSRDFKTVMEGPNNSVWTNFDYAQTGIDTAEIIFTYATAQNLGSADLFFYQDSYSARLPESVKLYWSTGGEEESVWHEINAVETIGETPSGTPNITPYNYRFDGVPAVEFKIVLEAQPGKNAQGSANLVVGLSEVELIVQNSSLTVHDKAELEGLSLNGVAVDASALNSKVIETEYQKVVVDAISESNASITVLPEKDGVIHIITESEDHQERMSYQIILDQEFNSEPLPADDDVRDVPKETTKATAGAYHAGNATEGDPNYAIDDNGSTFFHSPWGGTSKDNFWFTLEFEEDTMIESLRYKSRSGGTNGIVEKYIVETSLDGITWTNKVQGTWTNKQSNWSLAEFEEPVLARYVRLTAVTTYGEGAQANLFFTAQEVRVRKAVVKESIVGFDAVLEQNSFVYNGEAHKPKVTLSKEDSTGITILLEEGIDYKLSYENNIAVGTANALIQGIAEYGGLIELPFTIIGAPVVVDKAVLKLAIDAAKALESKETQYTPKSWAVLEGAYTLGETVYASEFASQTEVDEAAQVIREAIAALLLRADKVSLVKAISDAKAIDLSLKTEASIKDLESAIRAGEVLLDDLDIDQVSVDGAIAAIERAVDNLVDKEVVVPTDKTLLEELLETAKAIDTTDKTSESSATLEDAIADAEAVVKDSDASQDDVDLAVKQLQEAIDGLVDKEVEIPVDTTELEELLQSTKELEELVYTPQTWNVLAEAVSKASAVLANQDSSQEEVGRAYDQLKAAIDNLVKHANTQALTEALEDAKALDTSDKTSGSVDALNLAIEQAEAILDDLNASQEAIDKALDNLRDAIAGLVDKEATDPVDPVDPKDPVDNDEGSLPSTGMDSSTLLPMGVITSALGLILLLGKKRQSKLSS